ncbi:MAG: thioredoxin family protein [Beijerinckiaceae bacterium]
MIHTLSRRAVIAGVIATSATSVLAQSNTPSFPKYTQAAFDAAQASGKSIIVDVTAPWCPTCKAQAPILKRMNAKTEYSNVTVLEVDFDSQKDVLKKLKVQSQSTLIAFKGKAETLRSIGETKPAEIEKLFKSAI